MENTEAFLTALKSNSERDLELLAPLNKTNLEGDSSADLTITCGSARFRVHRYILGYRSPVFRAMLDSPMREAREGEITIHDMNSTTLSSMIHYMYTGELVSDWQDLDILDMVMAADMYDLPGWVKLLDYWTIVSQSTKVTGEIVADLIIAGSRHEKFKHLQTEAISLLRRDSHLTSDEGFVEKLGQHDPLVMIDFMKALIQEIKRVTSSEYIEEKIEIRWRNRVGEFL